MAIAKSAPKAAEHRRQNVGLKHSEFGARRESGCLFLFAANTSSSSAL